jgi:ankyrin repeat protein
VAIRTRKPASRGTHRALSIAQQKNCGAARLLITSWSQPMPASHALRPANGALVAAAGAGNVRALEQGIASGADIDAVDACSGRTPLITAAAAGHLEAAKALIRHGADLDALDRTGGETALGWAACMGHHAVVELLIRAGAALDLTGGNTQYTPLMHAAINGHCATASALIAAGAEVHRETAMGCNALSLAERNGHGRLVDLLLTWGARRPAPRQVPAA